MGYYTGELSISQAKDLARNTAVQATNRANVPRGWCSECSRNVRLVPTRDDKPARFVHADDGTPLCALPDDNGIYEPVGTMTLCRDCHKAIVVWLDTWVDEDEIPEADSPPRGAVQAKVWRHVVKPGCFHDPEPVQDLWSHGGTFDDTWAHGCGQDHVSRETSDAEMAPCPQCGMPTVVCQAGACPGGQR